MELELGVQTDRFLAIEDCSDTLVCNLCHQVVLFYITTLNFKRFKLVDKCLQFEQGLVESSVRRPPCFFPHLPSKHERSSDFITDSSDFMEIQYYPQIPYFVHKLNGYVR